MTRYMITALAGIMAITAWNCHHKIAISETADQAPYGQADRTARYATANADDYEVLTRGPVHEAYAEPVSLDAQGQYKISQRPPADIEEMPPGQKPEGDNVVWISGYWAYDDDRADFIWVSGCWRVVPPGREWIAGYWAEADDGYVWTPGYWQSADADETAYLPPPPDSLEEGPQGRPAPSADYIWTPGVWVRETRRYVWQPGCWMQARPDWVWMPAHYECRPQGYVFVAGYWDYPFERRGLLFSPVCFSDRIYSYSGFVYSPQIVISVDVIRYDLFSCPTRHHYYFGDYYSSVYVERGFHPWFQAPRRQHSYDPIYAHDQWRNRGDNQWARQLQTNYEHRRDDRNARPSTTYKGMQAQVADLPRKDRARYQTARPLKDVASAPDRTFRFETLTTPKRQELATSAKEVRRVSPQRPRLDASQLIPTVDRNHLTTPVKPPTDRIGPTRDTKYTPAPDRTGPTRDTKYTPAPDRTGPTRDTKYTPPPQPTAPPPDRSGPSRDTKYTPAPDRTGPTRDTKYTPPQPSAPPPERPRLNASQFMPTVNPNHLTTPAGPPPAPTPPKKSTPPQPSAPKPDRSAPPRDTRYTPPPQPSAPPPAAPRPTAPQQNRSGPARDTKSTPPAQPSAPQPERPKLNASQFMPTVDPNHLTMPASPPPSPTPPKKSTPPPQPSAPRPSAPQPSAPRPAAPPPAAPQPDRSGPSREVKYTPPPQPSAPRPAAPQPAAPQPDRGRPSRDTKEKDTKDTTSASPTPPGQRR